MGYADTKTFKMNARETRQRETKRFSRSKRLNEKKKQQENNDKAIEPLYEAREYMGIEETVISENRDQKRNEKSDDGTTKLNGHSAVDEQARKSTN